MEECVIVIGNSEFVRFKNAGSKIVKGKYGFIFNHPSTFLDYISRRLEKQGVKYHYQMTLPLSSRKPITYGNMSH